MTALLNAVGEIFTAALGWVGDIVGMITQETVSGTLDYPLLLLFIILPLVGLGVGLFRRLIHVR